MCLVLKCMQENISMHRIFCPWYIIYVPALWFLCFWISTHHSLTYWIWISTYHPLIYNHFFLFIFLFCICYHYLYTVEWFCTWKLLRVNLYTFIRPNQEQLWQNATTGPWQESNLGLGALRFYCIGTAGLRVSLLDL
jgi:hypothetical protein